MSRPITGDRSADTTRDTVRVGREASAYPADFDVAAWTHAACEASGVPFAVEDPVALAKLRDLAEHPV